jgi:hypothetical protein
MLKHLFTALAGLTATTMLLVTGAVAAASADTSSTHSRTDATVTVLKATLTGKYLHTTSAGAGTATITFKPGQVCWKLSYRGLDKPGDSGIHIAPPPAPGTHKRSVFPFTATTSTAPGCVPADHWGTSSAGWAQKIAADPARFYVIVATAKYPQGAIGGVLHGS